MSANTHPLPQRPAAPQVPVVVPERWATEALPQRTPSTTPVAESWTT